MNDFEIYETVKEFTVYTGIIKETLKARISKLISDNKDEPELYFWFISHYYKPEKDSLGVYIPSRNFSESIEETESLLMKYIKNFTDFDVQKNKNY